MTFSNKYWGNSDLPYKNMVKDDLRGKGKCCRSETWIYIKEGKWLEKEQFSSVQFSRSVMSDSLRPHGLQHAKPPCPLPTPGVYSNSCPSSWWCHPTFSSSIISFSSRLQSFSASGSFPMSQLFASNGQSIGVSASALVLHPWKISISFLFSLDKI